MCLYCNDRCHPFNSLEAVRKHMVAKSHCRVHYGDGDEEEEAELEEFYDYSSRFLSFLMTWLLRYSCRPFFSLFIINNHSSYRGQLYLSSTIFFPSFFRLQLCRWE
jgi:hypothetical protein